jgi:hypothetical protein
MIRYRFQKSKHKKYIKYAATGEPATGLAATGASITGTTVKGTAATVWLKRK